MRVVQPLKEVSSPSSAGVFVSSGSGLLPFYPMRTHALNWIGPQPSGHMDDHTFIMEPLTMSLGVQVKFSKVHLLNGFSEKQWRRARQ